MGLPSDGAGEWTRTTDLLITKRFVQKTNDENRQHFGRSAYRPRLFADQGKQPLIVCSRVALAAPKETFLRRKRGACDPPGR